jgi:two-component system sensor histidine kinase UhpB
MPETKILIFEHDLQDVELMQYELAKGGLSYVSKIVQNQQDYISALEQFLPDIILSDYAFPSFDGLSAFKLRESIAPDTPFIFVSGAIGEEISVELIKKGVTDFVLKNKLFTLCSKVNRALLESIEKRQKNKADQDLIRSEQRLSRAQAVAHMGSWEFDFATNDILWSDETFRIYGLPPGQNRQSFAAALEFIHPEDLALVLKELKRAKNALGDFSINFRIVRKGGLTRYIYLESKLELDPSGKPSGFHGTVHDVTDTVLLENKLVEERSTRRNEITEAVMTAQENERAYIGRELHENINQILAVVSLYIQMANTYVEDREMYLDKSYSMVGNVIEEIRKISKTLVIPALNSIGLFGSIRNLLYDLSLIHSVKIEFYPEGISEEFLNEKLQLTIFRIIQEQMTNILKHAKASRAAIGLSRSENNVILLISDNGSGCDILKGKNGVGIINIKSRVEAYQGQVTILTKPGKGYELKVVLPLNRENIPGNNIVAYVPEFKTPRERK